MKSVINGLLSKSRHVIWYPFTFQLK